MKKRILSMLLAICLIVGLLPMTTLHVHAAVTQANETIAIYGKTYTASGSVTSYGTIDADGVLSDAVTTEPEVWHVKFGYESAEDVGPTLTLKNATLGKAYKDPDRTEDGLDLYGFDMTYTGNMIVQSKSTTNPLNIVAEGPCTIYSLGRGIQVVNRPVNIITDTTDADSSLSIISAGSCIRDNVGGKNRDDVRTITLNGNINLQLAHKMKFTKGEDGTVTFDGTGTKVNDAPIDLQAMNLTVAGGNVTIAVDPDNANYAIWLDQDNAYTDGNFVQTGGHLLIKAKGSVGTGDTGTATVEGGIFELCSLAKVTGHRNGTATAAIKTSDGAFHIKGGEVLMYETVPVPYGGLFHGFKDWIYPDGVTQTPSYKLMPTLPDLSQYNGDYIATAGKWDKTNSQATDLETYTAPTEEDMQFYTYFHVEPHTHKYTSEKDAAGHWTVCECGATTDKVEHSYGEWADGERACTVCGYGDTCTHTYDSTTDAYCNNCNAVRAIAVDTRTVYIFGKAFTVNTTTRVLYATTDEFGMPSAPTTDGSIDWNIKFGYVDPSDTVPTLVLNNATLGKAFKAPTKDKFGFDQYGFYYDPNVTSNLNNGAMISEPSYAVNALNIVAEGENYVYSHGQGILVRAGGVNISTDADSSLTIISNLSCLRNDYTYNDGKAFTLNGNFNFQNVHAMKYTLDEDGNPVFDGTVVKKVDGNPIYTQSDDVVIAGGNINLYANADHTVAAIYTSAANFLMTGGNLVIEARAAVNAPKGTAVMEDGEFVFKSIMCDGGHRKTATAVVAGTDGKFVIKGGEVLMYESLSSLGGLFSYHVRYQGDKENLTNAQLTAMGTGTIITVPDLSGYNGTYYATASTKTTATGKAPADTVEYDPTNEDLLSHLCYFYVAPGTHEHENVMHHVADYHWTVCNICGLTEKAPHDWESNLDEKCNTCGYTRVVHTHAYDTYEYNDTHHWTVCDCTDKTAEVPHDFKYSVKTPAGPGVDEVQEGVCVCGATDTKVMAGTALPVVAVNNTTGAKYATMQEAIAAAKIGETVELKVDGELTEATTLITGVKYVIPEGITLTVKANVTAQMNAVLDCAGLIVVESGKVDISELIYGSTFAKSGGKLTIKKDATAVMPNTWEGKWNPITDATQHGGMLVNCEDGAIVNVAGEIWKLDGEAWEHTNHVSVVIPAVGATCTSTGWTEGSKCSYCGEILTAPVQTSALDHKWTDDHDTLCDRGCGETRDPIHDFSEELTAGETTHWYACSCGEKSGETAHVYKNYKANGDAAIGENETETGTCACGATDTREIPNTALKAVAKVGETEYADLQAAVDAANGGTVVLLDSLDLKNGWIIVDGKTVTLDLDGNILTGSGWDGVIHAINGANVTITGNGAIVAKEAISETQLGIGKDYAMVLFAEGENTVVTIKNGTFSNENTNGETQEDMIYVKYGATVNIEGGTFNCATPKWTLNSNDTDKGTIVVSGGTFYKYNPAASETEDPVANFLAKDLHIKAAGEYFTVCAGTVGTELVKGETTHWNTCSGCDAKFNETAHVYENYNANGDAAIGKNETETGTCVCGATDTREIANSALTAVAKVGETEYADLQAAVDAANGGTVVLLDSLDLKNGWIIVDGKTVTLDLDGNILTGSGWDGVIHAINGANVTITGNGAIVAKEAISETQLGIGKDYAMVLFAEGENTVVTIKNGTFSNENTNDETQEDMIYVKYGGTVNIEDGTFNCATPKWTLNSNDTEKGTFVVSGGEFLGYNPAESATESPVANFLADGLHTKAAGEYFTVCAGTVGTELVKGETTHWNTCSGCDAKFNETAHVYENYKPNGDAAIGQNETETGTCVCGATDTREIPNTALKAVAKVGETEYADLQAAVNAANGGTVVLLNSLDLKNGWIIVDGKTVTLDLDGNILTGSGWDGVIHAINGANVTITGNGAIVAKEAISETQLGIGKDYAMVLFAEGANTVVTIENGTFSNENTNGETQEDMIYVKYGATVNIEDGTFNCATPKWTLNSHDTHKGTIVVSGGTFYKYNPAASETEDPVANFLAKGLHTKAEGDNFTVCTGNPEVIPAVGATCTTTGLTEGSKCSDCDLVYNAPVETPELDHLWSEDGHVTECLRDCGETRDPIHSVGTAWEKDGSTHWNTCSGCEEKFYEAPHDYDDGVVTVEPGLNNEGEKTFTCATCGHIYTQVIAPTNGNAVAKIGSVYYESLIDAYEAAVNGDEIVLLKNVTMGEGLVITKSITIDFNGKSYFISTPVGSNSTVSNGFQILKEAGAVTLKNGTLSTRADKADLFYILIQNYADLTITDMVLAGYSLDKYAFTDGDSYVLSNNSGNVTINGNTVIKVNTDGNLAFALDSCKFKDYDAPVVTIEGNVEIRGNMELTGGTINYNGGTYNGTLVYSSGSATKAESVTVKTAEGYCWSAAGVLGAHNPVGATCCELGICANCGKAGGELLAHTEVVDEGFEATCTLAGKTDGKHCSVCGTVTVVQHTIPSKGGHNFEFVETVKPTNKTGGYDLYVCSGCGARSERNRVAAISKAVVIFNGTYYTSFADAWDAAKESDADEKVITFLRNIRGGALVVDFDVTIDFDGHYYTAEANEYSAAIVNNAKLTLKGNGILEVNFNDRKTFDTLIVNNGTLNVENVTLKGVHLQKTEVTVPSYIVRNAVGAVVNASEDTIVTTRNKYAVIGFEL